MNRFIINLLKLSGIIALVGVILLVVGICNGGLRRINSLGRLINDRTHYMINIIDSDEDDDIYDQNKTVDGNKEIYTFEASDIVNLNADIGDCALIVESSKDADEIVVKIPTIAKTEVYVDDDVLNIITGDIKGFGKKDIPTIILELPDDMDFDSVDMEIGAGAIEVNKPMECEKIVLDVAAGSIDIKELKSNELIGDIDAGKLMIAMGDTEDAEFDIGMGYLEYKGEVAGELSVDCNMGSADIFISSPKDQHNYYCQTNAGSIEVGGTGCNGLSSSRSIENDADSDYYLECNMGSINVEFASVL